HSILTVNGRRFSRAEDEVEPIVAAGGYETPPSIVRHRHPPTFIEDVEDVAGRGGGERRRAIQLLVVAKASAGYVRDGEMRQRQMAEVPSAVRRNVRRCHADAKERHLESKPLPLLDRKSTRLNSSHQIISY